MSFPNEPFLEGQVVLEDTVVDHDDGAGTIGVRVGVVLRRAAVGCPAGVAQAHRPFERPLAKHRLEVPDLPGTSPDLKLLPVQDGNSGRVIPPILETPEAGEDDLSGRLTADVAYDPAHTCLPKVSSSAATPRRRGRSDQSPGGKGWQARARGR